MTKIVINKCFGGFGLSPEAILWLHERNCPFVEFTDSNESRTCPLLVECVEELGEKSFGACASLKVVEIPDGVEWTIDEYDGKESIEEKHQSWG